MNVLFLSAWYPHRYDAMSGLFVQKHAEAVNLYVNTKVLYVYPDDTIKTFEIVDRQHNNLNEIIVYFPIKPHRFYHKISKVFNYLRAYKKGFDYLHKKNFQPDIVQSNILTRTGVIAYFYKKWKKVPYVVMEHWSRYLTIRNAYQGFFRKKITEKIVKMASAVICVSESLKKAMLNHKLYCQNYYIVYNVVDDFFFEEKNEEKKVKKRILHVSCFDEAAKNISGLLNVIKKTSMMRDDFEIVLVGTGFDFEKLQQHAQTLEIRENVVYFVGEKTSKEVARYFGNCDFFVMFSNFENAPVVISESLSVGKPVISTNVGGISEMIDCSNGILVERKDEEDLFEKINLMLDNFRSYNSEQIQEKAKEKYSYENVGKKFYNIYSTILK